jgi:hypothetical protein
MACRGVFFALTEEQSTRLSSALDDDELMGIIEEIEEEWDEDNLAECDKAWDAMHRCLSDGTLDGNAGSYPLNRCVLGGKSLHEGNDYIVCLVSPPEVRDVAAALAPLTEQWFRDRYFSVVPNDYCLNYGEEDFQYTWDWFQGVRDLYRKAAEQGKAVAFTVDQ